MLIADKMDLKADDIFNIDIDPSLLLSYELDKLNLDSISNDIFDLSDEIIKIEDKSDGENVYVSGDNKTTETTVSKSIETGSATSFKLDKSCGSEVKVEAPSRMTKRKIDINGNEEPLSDESLNELFVKLELSDSDNEEVTICSKLKERGPTRPRRRANRNRDPKHFWSGNADYDRSQFSSEKLKFWSGSSQIHCSEMAVPVQKNQTLMFNLSELGDTSLNQELFYEESRASSVNSPESGYGSSAHSITGSPPPASISTALNLDFIPETGDDSLWDFVMEKTDSALSDNIATHDADHKGKINEILNFLKDTPAELSKSSNPVAVADDSIPYHVPLVNHAEDSNIPSMKLSPVSCSPVLKSMEPSKKLVYKLNNEAKNALRDILSKDEFYKAKERIYKTIGKEKNETKIKVIYVEDEGDKASENRSNLHHAVISGKIEEIYCLVEIHKQYNKPFKDINIRDKYGKTALDYAVDQMAIREQMMPVVKYLQENTACQSVKI